MRAGAASKCLGGLAATAHALRISDLATIYQDQKAALDALHIRTNTDVFVATFAVRASKERPNDASSFATWSAGVDTLLPKSDYLILNRNPGTSTAEILIRGWDEVERTCGKYLETTTESPARYRVRAFPTEQEWEALKSEESERSSTT